MTYWFCSASIEQHKQHLRQVFECLSRAKLQISLEKSIFFTTAVEFLGFIVSKEGVQPDPVKLEPLVQPGKPLKTSMRSDLF